MGENVDPLLQDMVKGSQLQAQAADEWATHLAQVYFLVKDDEIQQMLLEDPDLKVLMPVLSSMVRTSNLTKKTVALAKIQWRKACRLQLLLRKPPTLANLSKFDVWLIHGYAALEDALEGWRGRLVTEKIRSFKIETDSKKRGRFLGMLGR